MSSCKATSLVMLLGVNASPNVNRVQIALNLKGIPYELIEEDLFNKSELLLASNPVYKKIPVLINEGRSVCESLLIVEYIDEVWTNDPCILPSDPIDRATARFWASFLDEQWIPLLIMLRDRNPDEANLDEKRDLIVKIKEGLLVLEEAFVKCSKGKDFFSGDSIGFLDIALGGHLGWIWAVEKIACETFLDELKCPNLCKWSERFSSDEAVKGVTPETRQLIEILEMFRSNGWFDSTRI